MLLSHQISHGWSILAKFVKCHPFSEFDQNKHVLGDYSSDYKSRLISLNLLPVMYS